MRRLIDADALKKLRHDYIQGRLKFDGSEYDLIDKCPTIDAAPVAHGRWEHDDWDLASCSVCGMIAVEDGTNYCPNCGAKMDLEVDGDG